MLAVRNSSVLRAAPAALARTATAVPRRGVVTAAERWNEDDWHNAHALVKTNSVSLDKLLPNLEGKWKDLSKPEQIGTWVLLEDIMKKDWNELSLTEKRAAYFISYGPYGPRKQDPPGVRTKIFIGVVLAVAAGYGMSATIQAVGGAKDRPQTWSKEWQEAMNERALEEKNDPITGPSSEGYKGKGFVTSYPI